ncbi:MAG: hypothetical protein ACE5HX_11675 [bacterium]
MDVETNVQITEGRIFLDQLNKVSHVLSLKSTEVEFKGEPIFKTGYLGRFKSLTLYKCPNGYFLFGDKAFGKNNWSIIGSTLDELLTKIPHKEIKKKITEEVAAGSEAA